MPCDEYKAVMKFDNYKQLLADGEEVDPTVCVDPPCTSR